MNKDVISMMVSFDVGDSQKFNLRAVCLIIKENRILFQRFNNDDYWFLPGGRVEMMEETQETIEREVLEEYGWKIRSQRLVWIVENFFKLNNKDFHEVGFYYLAQLDDEVELTETDFECLEGISTSRWIPIDELDQHKILPEFIRQGIDIPQLQQTREVKHIINRG